MPKGSMDHGRHVKKTSEQANWKELKKQQVGKNEKGQRIGNMEYYGEKEMCYLRDSRVKKVGNQCN